MKIYYVSSLNLYVVNKTLSGDPNNENLRCSTFVCCSCDIKSASNKLCFFISLQRVSVTIALI